MENEATFHISCTKFNNAVFASQILFEEWNSARNYDTILEKFKNGLALDIDDEPKDNSPVILVGSGPSLDDSIIYLKQWKGKIICSPSQAVTLIYHDVIPDYIVVIDPFDYWGELQGIDWSKTKTKLIVHPGVKLEIINNWPNGLLFFIEDVGKHNDFYSIQKIMYSEQRPEGRTNTYLFDYYIRTELPMFSCSPPLQMLAANVIGYESIFLCGFDFAYVGEKSRFTEYTVYKGYLVDPTLVSKITSIWEVHYGLSNEPRIDLVETKNGLISRESHIFYKRNVLSAYRLICKTMYSTDHGALTEVPYLSIEQVIERQGKGFPKQSKDFIIEETEKYLASVDGYVIEKKDGKLVFVEAFNSPDDILRYMLENSKEVDVWHNIKRIMQWIGNRE